MPAMPMPQGQGGARPMTTFDKWKMGAMMGGSVGLIMGFMYGAYHVMRFGGGINGPMRTMGQYMIGSATTFGFFMSIGSVIRMESNSVIANEAFSRARRQPVIMPARYWSTGRDEKE